MRSAVIGASAAYSNRLAWRSKRFRLGSPGASHDRGGARVIERYRTRKSITEKLMDASVSTKSNRNGERR
jgi:hypothetical protein